MMKLSLLLFIFVYVGISFIQLDGYKLLPFVKQQKSIHSKHKSNFIHRTAILAKNNEERKISRDNEGEFFESEVF